MSEPQPPHSSSVRMLRGKHGGSSGGITTAGGMSASRRRTLSHTAKDEALPAFAVDEGLNAGGKKLKVGQS